jgi:hypothetical protein
MPIISKIKACRHERNTTALPFKDDMDIPSSWDGGDRGPIQLYVNPGGRLSRWYLPHEDIPLRSQSKFFE